MDKGCYESEIRRAFERSRKADLESSEYASAAAMLMIADEIRGLREEVREFRSDIKRMEGQWRKEYEKKAEAIQPLHD